ncbi:MAG: hypothetical protein KGL31_04870 [candidate division NC10 bacterium]|nr:hypothetical protein [candidate division NC10 bacterium]
MGQCCCAVISRRTFLRAMGVGAIALALPNPVFGESPQEAARRLIERYAADRQEPWLVMHGVRALGRGFSLGDVSAVDYLLTNDVRAKDINGTPYLYVPREVEGHTSVALKTLLEAGVPREKDIRVEGGRYHLNDLAEGAKALLTFDPRSFDKDDLAWSLIAFSELRAEEWTNAYGQKVRLKDLVAFGFETIEEATRGMGPYAAGNRPLPQKFPIHRFTCGGTHSAYSLVAAARHGYAGAYRRTLQEQLDLMVYRLWADVDLIDRFYAGLPSGPWEEANRLEAKLKFTGHAFEVLHYAKRHAIFTPTSAQKARMEEGLAALYRIFSAVAALDLKMVKVRDRSLYSLFIGDLCHAYRGVRLA